MKTSAGGKPLTKPLMQGEGDGLNKPLDGHGTQEELVSAGPPPYRIACV